MKRSTRLEKLADINSGYENMALAALASARAQFQKQEDQLNQLKIYRDDYRAQLAQRMQDTTSASVIRDFQYFFSSLEDAITQQTLEVEKAAVELDKVEQNWLNSRREVKKFSQAASNLKQRELADMERQSQLESDELNTANYLLRARNNQLN